MFKIYGFTVSPRVAVRAFVCLLAVVSAGCVTCDAFAQGGRDDGAPTFFVPGYLVVVVEGCGVYQGTCVSVPNGTGTGTLNSSNGGYGDNQAAPLTLMQFAPNAAASATYVNSLVLPQTGSGANLPISGEYGSSSEGGLQLSGTGQYLTLGTYGINAATFNAATATSYGDTTTVPALAQTGSLTGQTTYTPVARVVTLVDAYGDVNSSTGVFNIFNTNNPRSVYSANGTTAYMSGQGASGDATAGVFVVPTGVTTTSPTAITGLDTTANTVSQDSRFVTVFNNTLYVSVDSKGGSNNARSFVGTLGTPPATGVYSSNAGPTEMSLANNASTPIAVTSNGQVTLTASEVNSINSGQVGKTVNISPSGYFFANAYTLYIADTGNSKQTTNGSKLGAGGLQKWINTKTDGTGTWELMYTMSLGLNLVANPTATPANTSGSTGLYALTGVINGSNVYLYATNATIADLDQTYLYGISDPLASTTNPGTAFAVLATAPADSNFKGVSFAPSLPAGSATITTAPEGLQVTTAGTGCAAGTYVTPVTLTWTPSSNCTLSVATPQTANGTKYVLTQWQDGTTATTDTVTAPTGSAVYTATFTTSYAPVGNLERVIDSTTLGTTVSQSDQVYVGGWVADPVDGSPLSNVKAYIDGVQTGTLTLGISRSDVASTTGRPAYANSGYSLYTPASGLSLGSHAVTVIAIDSTGKTTTFGPLSFTVTAPAAKPPVGNLETAQDATTGASTVAHKDALAISGWAGDPQDGSPVKTINVYIDGNLAGAATKGIARQDVVSYTGNAAYANSGYSFSESSLSLSAGSHAVTVVATDTAGLSTTFGPVNFTVVNTPPIGNLEQAVDASTSSSTVSRADTLFVSGWAADYQDNGAAKSVQVFIDGNAAGFATLGGSRTDVANYYNNSSFGTTGFSIGISVSGLSLGSHSVTAVATDSLGLTTTFGPASITVTQ